jgi:hypothetical protein
MPAAYTQEEDNALPAAIPSGSPVGWNAVAAALSGGRSRCSVWLRFSNYLVATPVGQAMAHFPVSLKFGQTPFTTSDKI